MALLTKQANTKYTLTNKEEYRSIIPVFNGYQTNIDNVDLDLYFGDFATTVAVSTGTVADSSEQPILARKYEATSVYNYGTNARPISYRDTLSRLVTSTGASSGIVFSGRTFSIDSTGFVCFVAKVTTATTVILNLRSSVGNQKTFTFTVANFPANSNGFTRFIAPLTVGTYTGVTVAQTGVLVHTAINNVEVLGGQAGTINAYSISFANNPSCFIGHQNTFLFDCLNEVNYTMIRETAERMCFNYVTGTTVTKTGFEIELKYNDLDDSIQAGVLGEAQKNGSVNNIILQNGEAGALTSNPITAGVIAIIGLDATRIAGVVVNGGKTKLDRVSSLADISSTTYFYDTATGFTFSTIYNSEIPSIYYTQSTTGNFMFWRNQKTGLVGNLIVTRKSADGRTLTDEFFAVELTEITPEQGDAQVSHMVKLVAYPVKVGSDFRFAKFANI